MHTSFSAFHTPNYTHLQKLLVCMSLVNPQPVNRYSIIAVQGVKLGVWRARFAVESVNKMSVCFFLKHN